MNNEIKENIILFSENCKKMIGLKMNVYESISRNKDNFDRHFTTFSNFDFVLTGFGIRTSGAKIMLMGIHSNYEIDSVSILEFREENDSQFYFLEGLSETVYRRSILKFSKP